MAVLVFFLIRRRLPVYYTREIITKQHLKSFRSFKISILEKSLLPCMIDNIYDWRRFYFLNTNTMSTWKGAFTVKIMITTLNTFDRKDTNLLILSEFCFCSPYLWIVRYLFAPASTDTIVTIVMGVASHISMNTFCMF